MAKRSKSGKAETEIKEVSTQKYAQTLADLKKLILEAQGKGILTFAQDVEEELEKK